MYICQVLSWSDQGLARNSWKPISGCPKKSFPRVDSHKGQSENQHFFLIFPISRNTKARFNNFWVSNLVGCLNGLVYLEKLEKIQKNVDSHFAPYGN